MCNLPGHDSGPVRWIDFVTFFDVGPPRANERFAGDFPAFVLARYLARLMFVRLAHLLLSGFREQITLQLVAGDIVSNALLVFYPLLTDVRARPGSGVDLANFSPRFTRLSSSPTLRGLMTCASMGGSGRR